MLCNHLFQQAFRQAAGFSQSQLSQKDKWLGRISLDGALEALALGLIPWLDHPETDLNVESLTVLCNILLETSYEGNTEVLHKALEKLATAPNSARSLQTLTRAFRRAKDGNRHPHSHEFKPIIRNCFIMLGFVVLHPGLLHSILHHKPQLMEAACNELCEGTSQKDESWLVKASAQHFELYQELCTRLMTKQDPTILSKFVENVSRQTHSLIALYPAEEQACVILYQAVTLLKGHQSHPITLQLVEELIQLWSAKPEGVLKLLAHFPTLAEILIDLCDRQEVGALRLCLHLQESNTNQ